MFTGIVEEVGAVNSSGPGRLTVAASTVTRGLEVSDSICVNGACLTVVSCDDASFSVDVVPETLRRTNLGLLEAGDPVNLERSLSVEGRFGGHFVQGHVDATATIESITREDEALMVVFSAPQSIMRYVVEKGFVSVDGVSLTVVNCDSRSFAVTIVPYTRDNTTFGARAAGDTVNLEADVLAKYVERLTMGARPPVDPGDEL